MGLRFKTTPKSQNGLWLVARGLAFVIKSKKGKPGHGLPRKLLLTTLLGDTWANRGAIAPIRKELSAIGLPIKEWMIEFDEHLYNFWGEETYEPVLHRDYLRRTARAMWNLSVRVFAHSTFSYETLAAQMREPDAAHVRLAVKRLAIICTDKKSVPSCPFEVGQDYWKWSVKSGSQCGRSCEYGGISEVEMKLEDVKAPGGTE
jgi:hypothetical protein